MSMRAQQIVDAMMADDRMSRWLGIEVLEVQEGACRLRMQAREEMCNGFGVIHGGITYSFADSALAFACNSHGIKTMSIETSISHTAPVHPGDMLTATARELSLKNRIAVYEITVRNQDDAVVGLFKGTVYRSGKEWGE